MEARMAPTRVWYGEWWLGCEDSGEAGGALLTALVNVRPLHLPCEAAIGLVVERCRCVR